MTQATFAEVCEKHGRSYYIDEEARKGFWWSKLGRWVEVPFHLV